MSPDKVQARKMVLVGLLVLTLITVYKDRRSSDPAGTFRVFWGVGVVGMFLSLLADFLPQIAGPFAALIALGSLTNGGEQVLERALGVIAPRPSTGSSSSSSSPPGPGSSSSSNPPATVTHTTVVAGP
jgi:hypothetical protein